MRMPVANPDNVRAEVGERFLLRVVFADGVYDERSQIAPAPGPLASRTSTVLSQPRLGGAYSQPPVSRPSTLVLLKNSFSIVLRADCDSTTASRALPFRSFGRP
jgi:hypothetical protein